VTGKKQENSEQKVAKSDVTGYNLPATGKKGYSKQAG